MPRRPTQQTLPLATADVAELLHEKSSRVLQARTALAALQNQVEAAETELRAATEDFHATLAGGAYVAQLEADADHGVNEREAEHGEDASAEDGAQWRQIVGLLNAHPSEVFTSSEVCARLGFNKLASIRTMLATLVKKEHIRRVANGKYASLAGGRDVK